MAKTPIGTAQQVLEGTASLVRCLYTFTEQGLPSGTVESFEWQPSRGLVPTHQLRVITLETAALAHTRMALTRK